MQTAKANSKSKQSGKTAVRTPAVSEAVAAQAQDPVAAGSPDMKPAEPQATDIGAVNPVAETSPAEQPAAHPETDVRLLDLNKIVNSTYNPRKNFREETLLELAESIKQSGVLQPICVRPRDEGFEIVYGERRYWAAAMAGLKFIPALVRDLSDAEAEDAAIKMCIRDSKYSNRPTTKYLTTEIEIFGWRPFMYHLCTTATFPAIHLSLIHICQHPLLFPALEQLIVKRN